MSYYSLLRFMTEYQLNKHIPAKKGRMVEAMGKSHTTIYAWLKELQGQKRIDLIEGYWVVLGLEYTDKRDGGTSTGY